jgi:hypothetical protein
VKQVIVSLVLLVNCVMVIPGYTQTAGSFDWFIKPLSDYRNDDPYGQAFLNLNTDEQ